MMKEADSGDSGGPGFEAGWGVFRVDAAESVDGSGRGGEAGGVEGFEALAWGDELASDGFLEDGGEEDQVGVVASGFDLGEGMAGDRDDGRRKGGGGIEAPDLRGSELASGGGEMDSVGCGSESYVEAGVDEEPGGSVVERFEDLASERGQGCGGQVLFAELNIVDAFGGPAGGFVNEGSETGFEFAGEEGSVGDGIAAHGVSVGDLRLWMCRGDGTGVG